MATQQFDTSAAETRKIWSKLLFKEVQKAFGLSGITGSGKDAIIRLESKMTQEKGDRVRVTYTPRLNGLGVTENELLQGREEARLTYTDDITINELFHAVDVVPKGSIDDQRTIVSSQLYEDAMPALRDWFAERMSAGFFVQVGGYMGTSVTVEGTSFSLSGTDGGKFYGFNAPTAATNILRPNSVANDEDFTNNSANHFSLGLIDEVVARAQLLNPKIQPAMYNGQKKYVMYIHPWQRYQLRTQTGEGTWQDFAKRGPEHKDRLYDGAIGEYNNVIIKEHEHVAPGYDSTALTELPNVRRAVLLGRGAATIAYGKGAGNNRYFWRDNKEDYGRKIGKGAGTIYGMKKTTFNSQDWGVFVVPTWSAAPNV